MSVGKAPGADHPRLCGRQVPGGIAGCCWLVPLALSTPAYALLPPPIHGVEARLDRDFGYVMGAPLRQSLRVETDAEYALEEAVLPQPGGAVNDWLEVREVSWSGEADGAHTAYHIELTYQLFKGVREAETLSLPPLPLRFRRGDAVVEIQAPGSMFSVQPLIAPGVADTDVSIRGLHAPPPVPATAQRTALAAALIGLLGWLLYGAWRLGLPPFPNRQRLPFATALKELRRLRRLPPSPNTARHALRLFHGALNGYARRTVLEGQLPQLFRQHPELAAVQAELAEFFGYSHRLFFAGAGAEMPVPFSLSRLEALCRRCRVIERGRR